MNWQPRENEGPASRAEPREQGQHDHRRRGDPGVSQAPVSVLMVAEKPSIARSVADCLSAGRCDARPGTRRSPGLSKLAPVFEFPGHLFGQPVAFKVTSVAGHLYCRDFPQSYADWYRHDPGLLFDADTLKREVAHTH
jgi:DNA topoisomerase-3